MERFNPNINIGLNSKQINKRINDKLVNYDVDVLTKSYKQIVYENIFTLFNFINLFLGLLIFFTGEYKNLLFLGVVFCNTFISLIQEIRAKKAIDQLTVITSNKSTVIRDGKISTINNNEIVLDDLIKYKLGNQIIVDTIILKGNVIVDESFITGESDNIIKREGDKLLSGSFIVGGECIGRVDSVGEDNYTNKITSGAKYYKKINSEILNTLNRLIKFISVAIVPLGLLFFLKQYNITNNLNISITNTVAALIGTIPEGLILLTSSVFAVSSIRLAKKNVLTQNLYCSENLARVDTICLDKTGTLTTGNMKVKKVISLNSKFDIEKILGNICNHMLVDNSTSISINNYFEKRNDYKLINKIDFSSLTKCSIFEFDKGTFIMGALEFINTDDNINIDEYSKKYRTILVGFNTAKIVDNKVEEKFKIIGIILIEDELRSNAKEVIEYLKQEDINVKIISGDNIHTINNIVNKLGLNELKLYDMTNYKGENLDTIVEEYDVFGRVTPVQKKEILLALKNNKHKVAMTGDGVNDVLSLKEADSSITLSCASDAAKNVSELVLLDDDFKSLPEIIKEGRRTINNLERSSSLFLTKTGYAIILAFIFLLINSKYPFIPIQLTLVSVLTIGIPSFLLALEPNHDRVKGRFIHNIILKCIPASLAIVFNILCIIALSKYFEILPQQLSTIAVILTAFVGFVLLFEVCYTFNCFRALLFSFLLGTFIIVSIFFNKLFELVTLSSYQYIIVIILFIFDILLFNLLTKFIQRKTKD